MDKRMIFNNYGLNSVSDKTTTQAPLHSRFARVGEYPFSNSVLAGLRPNFASQNSTKLNIHRNCGFALQSRVQHPHTQLNPSLNKVKRNC
jgi:hypothetical protein